MSSHIKRDNMSIFEYSNSGIHSTFKINTKAYLQGLTLVTFVWSG
jgi:hypothetical protein